MPINAALRTSTRPRWITPHDASRCYLLYTEIDCNIPRRGRLGEPGAWNWSRGLLVELHQRLGGTAVALQYRELLTRHPHDPPDTPPHLPAGIEVTAHLHDRDNHDITVTTRIENAPHGPRGDYWQLTVNGDIPTDIHDPAFNGVHAYAPTLPFLALLVERHLRRTTSSCRQQHIER